MSTTIELHETYFRVDYFCKYNHDDVEYRQKTRKLAVDRAEDSGHSIVPIVEMDEIFYEKKAPRTIADLNCGLVSGSSSSLSRSALDTLPTSSGGVCTEKSFSPSWGVKQVTQRLRTAITLTSVWPSECTASECASQETRHRCLSVYSVLSSFLDRGCFSAIASSLPDAQDLLSIGRKTEVSPILAHGTQRM